MGSYLVAAYPLNTISRAIEVYSRRFKGDGSVERKLFLLNKFLFDIPEWLPRQSPHVPHLLAGWWGMPVNGDPKNPKPDDKFNVRWPWTADAHGEWHLTGRHMIYMGPPYDGLKMFEYLRRHFPRRKISQQAHPSAHLPPAPEVPALKSRRTE